MKIKQKSVRESIMDGTFNLKQYNEINYINPKLKELQNLQSWKQFYLNRCTDGTGNKVEIVNQRTNQPMMVDVQVSRKVPFRDYMYISKINGEMFNFSGISVTGRYLNTTKDVKDEEAAYFIDNEIKILQEQQRDYYTNKQKRNSKK